jgi:multiple sugar transport system substrate-binding protein
MWSPLTGGDGDVMTALAQQFSSENKQGITVRHTAQPEYIQKLNTSAAAKKLPTMTVIRAGDIPIMAARNILKPMGAEAMAAAGGDMSKDFPQQVWGAGDIGGKRYTIPLDVHPLVLYYNKDLFKKAGIPDPGKKPMTKQQFEQAAEKLNQGGNTGWAIGTLFSSDTLFQTLVRQFGGTLVNADGTQATYNSEAGVRALNYIKEMKQKYSPKISGAGDPEVVAFQQGKVGMVLHGPWWIGSLEKLPFTGFAPTPQFGEKYAVWGGSHQLGITTDDPAQQAAAGCWIGWLSSNSVQWAKAGQVPARNSVRLGKELATVAPPVAGFATEADDVILFPPIPGLESAVMTEASKAIAAVVQGQAQDAKAALDQAAARSNQLIQQNLKTYGTPKQ